MPLSEEIGVEMIDRGDVCHIFMTPDADWLNDQSRVYPITIDPQVTTSSSSQNIVDNYVMENSGVQTYTLDRLYIGKKNGNRTRSYIKFTNMPTIPTGSTITATQMTLWLTTGQSTGSNAAAYIVNGGDWSSKTISWANMPSASGPVSVDISHNNLTKYVFPCNYAVQTWYSGSTTGQNKNYGIMVRYYDESINDYNPVYSADYTTASKRPSLTITYQLPGTAASITEGSTYTLSSSGMSGTITWVSNNTSVATVNSSGKVTGVKAGKATITASVGGVVQKGFVVYVKISNGVYYLKNNGVNFYLGTGGRIADNTLTQMQSKSETGLSQVRQLWKITYLDNGYYSIRPMHKLDMAVGLSGSNVVIRKTSTTDSISAVPSGFWWTITYDSSGYNFRYYGSSGTVMRAADGASSPGLGVIVGPYTSTNANTKYQWTLTKLSSPPSGAYLYDTSTDGVVTSPKKYVAVGESKTLSDYNLLPIAYYYDTSSNDQTFSWPDNLNTSSNVTVNESTGQVAGISPSTNAVAITGTCHGQSVQYSVQVIPIADGTYKLRNRASEKYAYLWTNNSSFVQWDFSTDNAQKWIFTHLGEGVYSIRSADSTAPYYMGVSGDSSAIDQAVVPRSGTLTNGMKWRITATTNGFYKITPLTGISSNLVLAPESNNDGVGANGDILQQRSYVAGVHEWFLCREKDYALLYRGRYENDPNMPSLIARLDSALINNAQLIGFADTTMTTIDVRDHLISSRIFSCITHGTEKSIITSDGSFTIDDVNSLPNSAFDNSELICITACLTGSGGADAANLVNAIYNKGADAVVGFTVTINVLAADYWTEQFMLKLAQGSTILEAMDAADEALIYDSNIDDTYYNTVLGQNRYAVGALDAAPCA